MKDRQHKFRYLASQYRNGECVQKIEEEFFAASTKAIDTAYRRASKYLYPMVGDSIIVDKLVVIEEDV